MADVPTTHAFSGLKEFVELFEDASRERASGRVTLDRDFISPGVNLDVERSLDQPERFFTVSVEGNGGRIVIERQALLGRRIFLSQ